MPGLVLVAAIGIFLGLGVAAAEKVKTNQSTKLYNRPGEQARVLLTVKSGQSMTLLDQEGRWLKVRVQGRTGYVPRSKVDMADDGGIARNTRRRPFVDGRSKKRGFGGNAPDDRIGADATVEPERDDAEDEEEEPAPPPKKRVAAKASSKDEDDDEEEAPPKKQAALKASSKASSKAKSAAKEEEEDEEDDADAADDEDEGDDDAVVATKKRSGGGGDDEEDDGDPADKRPRARVSKKVSVREDPDEEAEESFVVVPTDILYPGDTRGNWTFVENDAADGGWIQTDLLELGGDGGSSGNRVIELRARTGVMIIQQGMRTAGSNVLNVPDNYNIGTSSVTVALGAGALFPRGSLILGGEFTYELAKTLGGGVFYDADKTDNMPGVNIGITVHNVNVRGVAGIDFKKQSGMALFGRLGYRYQGFLINDVANIQANPAQLPSEVVKGPTIGAALVIPRLSNKLGLAFALDAMVFGTSVTQTRGLEDGGSPTAKAVVLGAGVTYRALTAFDLLVGYDLKYMGVDFGAPLATSQRMHMGTNVSRTDIFHMVTVGIAKPF